MRTGILLILFFLSASALWSQPAEQRKDLHALWKVAEGNQLTNFEGQETQAIHFFISDDLKGGIISIKAPDEFALFINGQLLIRARSEFKLNVDSLLVMRAGIPLLSIFQKRNVKSLQTHLIYKDYLENENLIREPSHFNDFVIISVLILFGVFVFLFRSNTRLAVDYLNLAKVFSIQEREETIVTGRIGSSVNILFFGFISMLTGLLLMIIFLEGPEVLHFSKSISIHSTASAMAWWVILSIIIFFFLILKLLLIWSMSALFGFKGLMRFQFFNFIRSMFTASVLVCLILLGYFMLEFKNPDFFYFLLALACGFMILSAFFLYFKLMTRTSSSVFHLFSYLCGSEIIPLMILIKVLLN